MKEEGDLVGEVGKVSDGGAEVLKVLVVDDTAANRQILQVFLKKLGFGVVVADDGLEAVERFLAEQPDIVLMDVMMPGLDGFEATRRIKAACGSRWVPIVYLTALDTETDLVTGLDAGGDDYLTKPVSFAVLDAKLRSLQRTLALQRTLDDTRRRSEAITENIVDGVITVDDRGAIRSVNRAVSHIFGYPAEELVGRPVGTLMPDEDGGYSGGLACLSAAVGVTAPVRGIRRDGREIPLELAVSELQLEQERLFVGIVRDISRRVAAERQLRDNAERLQRYHDQQEEEAALAQQIIQRLTLREGIADPHVVHWLSPAANFSGDILIAVRSPQGRLYAMLGDATGHGLAAAISALPAVTVFYGMVRRNLPLSVMVGELNRHLRETLPAGRFFAVSLCCMDCLEDSAELWVGGMPSVLQVGADGTVLRRFQSRQLALGIVDFDDAMCATETVYDTAGSQFVLYSDGLLDAAGAGGEAFGLDRLVRVLAGVACPERLAAVRGALSRHLGQRDPHDDISLLMIDC